MLLKPRQDKWIWFKMIGNSVKEHGQSLRHGLVAHKSEDLWSFWKSRFGCAEENINFQNIPRLKSFVCLSFTSSQYDFLINLWQLKTIRNYYYFLYFTNLSLVFLLPHVQFFPSALPLSLLPLPPPPTIIATSLKMLYQSNKFLE